MNRSGIRKLFTFSGGVKPATHKADSTRQPIAPVPLPSQLIVPLHQSVGGTPLPLVQAGQHVLKGERIGSADSNFSSAIHAPTSGRVIAVEPHVMAHTSGLSVLSVVIEPDHEEHWCPTTPLAYKALAPDELRDALRDAGIVGMGGAVFPSHLKLKPGRHRPMRTLVINGAECEPFITCDDMLMRERPEKILHGIAVMQHLMGAEEVLIGIEDNKPEAIAAMQKACEQKQNISVIPSVVSIPTRYPAGGAKQLIRVLTGIEVPHGERSTDYGVQCFNVGTAYAMYEAVELGRPLISRIVTVAGHVTQPRNFEVLFGTPMNHLAQQAGWTNEQKQNTTHFIMGGPMMGYRMPAWNVPVIKATNCLIAATAELFPPPPPEMPCIRCGECARACPTDLQPFELYWHSRAKNFGKAQEYALFDCIECGCCSYVCPSNIPLVDYYRFAKSEIWSREQQKEAADTARERFELRNERIEREKREKAEKLAARTAAGQAKAQSETPVVAAETAPIANPAEDPKKALIAAALARAKAQKEQTQPANTDKLTAAQQAQIDEAEARRTAAQSAAETPPVVTDNDPKKALIAAAIERARQKKEAANESPAPPKDP